MSEPKRPGLTETILSLVSVAVMVWFTMPPQERMWVRLAVLQQMHRASDRLARKLGYQGMGDELAGRDFQNYDLAYRVALLRDRLARELKDIQL